MKKVVVHADDIGLSPQANDAALYAFKEGSVSSGSVIVNAPGFEDFVTKYHKLETSELDLGIHLTLTSEKLADCFKWGPVSTLPVKSLEDKDGYFHSTLEELFSHASFEDVRTEFISQVTKAKNAGLHITHIDSHMGAVFHNSLFNIYIDIAIMFDLQPFILFPKHNYTKGYRFYNLEDQVQRAKDAGFKVFDNVVLDPMKHKDAPDLSNIQEGSSYLICHLLTGDKSDLPDDIYNERLREFFFFSNPKSKEAFSKAGIKRIQMEDL